MIRFVRLGRAAFAATAAAFFALLATTIGRLPPLVASHFDGSGMPNAWSSRPRYAALMVAFGALLPLGTVGLVALLTRRGPHLLNIPAREYWRRPEFAAEAVRRSRAYMWWLAAILTATAAAIHVSVLLAHRSIPPHLDTPGILLVIGVLLVTIGCWAVGWYRLFRPDGAGERAG